MGMVPPDQRFHTDHFATVKVMFRLVVERQLAPVYCPTQAAVQAQPVFGQLVNLRIEDSETGAPVCLGAIHGDIRFAKEVGRAWILVHGHSRARGHKQFMSANLIRVRECVRQLLRERDATVASIISLDDRTELVATESTHENVIAGGGKEARGETRQEHIAERMPERVIDEFEAVDIEKEHGNAASRTIFAEGAVKQGLEHGAVGQARQRIE